MLWRSTLSSAPVKLNARQIQNLLTESTGPVARDVFQRGLLVQKLAKQFCPVDFGRLRSSIRCVMQRDVRGPVCRVGTEVRYAAAVHNGVQARTIRPVNGKVLRFEVGGVEVFASVVHQPARAGKPFLTRALVAAGVRATP